MATRDAVLELHILGVTEGHWCPGCFRWTAIEVTWAAADPDTLKVRTRGVSLFCDACGFDHLDEP